MKWLLFFIFILQMEKLNKLAHGHRYGRTRVQTQAVWLQSHGPLPPCQTPPKGVLLDTLLCCSFLGGIRPIKRCKRSSKVVAICPPAEVKQQAAMGSDHLTCPHAWQRLRERLKAQAEKVEFPKEEILLPLRLWRHFCSLLGRTNERSFHWHSVRIQPHQEKVFQRNFRLRHFLSKLKAQTNLQGTSSTVTSPDNRKLRDESSNV